MLTASDKKFVVIAGPNGAGKSSTSKTLLSDLNIPTDAFNWDARFEKNWRQFDYDSSPQLIDGIRNKTNQEFSRYLNRGFKSDTSVAYETNFHHRYNLERIEEAKLNGYIVIIHYLYLDSIATALERVQKRVALGGHHVTEEAVRDRYWNGFSILNEAIILSDYINVWDYSEDYDSAIMLSKLPDSIKVYKKLPERLYDKVPNLRDLGIDSSMVRARVDRFD